MPSTSSCATGDAQHLCEHAFSDVVWARVCLSGTSCITVWCRVIEAESCYTAMCTCLLPHPVYAPAPPHPAPLHPSELNPMQRAQATRDERRTKLKKVFKAPSCANPHPVLPPPCCSTCWHPASLPVALPQTPSSVLPGTHMGCPESCDEGFRPGCFGIDRRRRAV